MGYETNTSPFFTMSKYFSRCGRKIIHISMEHVFSGGVGGYREYYRMDPRNVFGKSRMKVEGIIIGSGKDFTIIRTSGIFCVSESSGKANFFLWVYRSLLSGKEIYIVKDQYYSPTVNTNLAGAISEIYDKGIDGVFHFSSIDRISRYDFALLIADAFSLNHSLIKPTLMTKMKWVAKRPRDSSLSVEKSVALLEKKPLKVEEEILLSKEEMLR